jgi:hypothetical protein
MSPLAIPRGLSKQGIILARPTCREQGTSTLQSSPTHTHTHTHAQPPPALPAGRTCRRRLKLPRPAQRGSQGPGGKLAGVEIQAGTGSPGEPGLHRTPKCTQNGWSHLCEEAPLQLPPKRDTLNQTETMQSHRHASARTRAHTHTHTHARTHARTHKHPNACRQANSCI